MNPNTFKLILIGDSGVGKTTMCKKMVTGEFEKKHYKTLGVEVFPIRFNTNHGPLIFNVWDCAGCKDFQGLSAGYYINADCFIVMFDLTSKDSFENIDKWIERTGVFPTILVGNKCDITDVKVSDRKICDYLLNHEESNCKSIQYYGTSYKTNYNFDEPFLDLAIKLTGFDDLKFIENITVPPPVYIKPNINEEDNATILKNNVEEDGVTIVKNIKTCGNITNISLTYIKDGVKCSFELE